MSSQVKDDFGREGEVESRSRTGATELSPLISTDAPVLITAGTPRRVRHCFYLSDCHRSMEPIFYVTHFVLPNLS